MRANIKCRRGNKKQTTYALSFIPAVITFSVEQCEKSKLTVLMLKSQPKKGGAGSTFQNASQKSWENDVSKS
jgi:hypothetical protein